MSTDDSSSRTPSSSDQEIEEGTHISDPETIPTAAFPVLPCLEQDWSEAYLSDPDWSTPWQECNTPDIEWPQGFRLTSHAGTLKLLNDQKICVPKDLAPHVMAALHSQIGHLGVARTVMEWKRRYLLTSTMPLIPMAKRMKSSCPICQACDPP